VNFSPCCGNWFSLDKKLEIAGCNIINENTQLLSGRYTRRGGWNTEEENGNYELFIYSEQNCIFHCLFYRRFYVRGTKYASTTNSVD